MYNGGNLIILLFSKLYSKFNVSVLSFKYPYIFTISPFISFKLLSKYCTKLLLYVFVIVLKFVYL